MAKPQEVDNLELERIIEEFYRGYDTDMAAVWLPIGTITNIEEQQRQSEHFWKKRMKVANEHILSLIQAQQKALIDLSVKYIRDGNVAGSFSDGCKCEKCDAYEVEVRNSLVKGVEE